jgi:hypothetical protein
MFYYFKRGILGPFLVKPAPENFSEHNSYYPVAFPFLIALPGCR